ncbi:MAG: DNA repair protein RecO [Chloroflexi bacterium]|nr:DNA repair protein RecO [Chloroflexota bacterium]
MMPDRERIYRTEAIVLKHSDFGEADRLLTVYTPYLGKLRLLAKGIRKPTSRKSGHLESFTRTQLLVARGRNLDIITQAQTIEPYLALRQDLWRMSHAYYVGELVDCFGEEQAENYPLYCLLCEALHWICQSSNLPLTMRFVEMQVLNLAGYRPQLFQCLRCNAALEPIVNYFSAAEGGMLCPRCGEGQRGAKPVSLAAFKALRYLQTREYADCARLQLSQATLAEVEGLLGDYLVYILEHGFKSVEFLRLLRYNAHLSGASYSLNSRIAS